MYIFYVQISIFFHIKIGWSLNCILHTVFEAPLNVWAWLSLETSVSKPDPFTPLPAWCANMALPRGIYSFQGTVHRDIKKRDQTLHINHPWSCWNSCKKNGIITDGLKRRPLQPQNRLCELWTWTSKTDSVVKGNPQMFYWQHISKSHKHKEDTCWHWRHSYLFRSVFSKLGPISLYPIIWSPPRFSTGLARIFR